ncbi:MAG: polysaccharide deacetylase family protein [Gammaproteobacteria bacterium]|nr:polysaccharide deacetylase family protein [Gammaproteobacteria bacterium]
MKKLLKKLFVPLLASAPVSAIATSFLGHGIPIFMIHRIKVEGQSNSGISPDHLRRCLRYLKDKDYTFVSLEDIIGSLNNQITLPKKSVSFTMDDGFLEQAEIAAPIFLEFNCPLTFFIITGLLDQILWPWDAQVSWIIDNTNKNHVVLKFEDEILNMILGNKNNRRNAREEIRNVIKEMNSESIPEIINNLADAADVQLPITAPNPYKSLNWEMARELESKGIRFAPHSMTHRILSKLNKKSAEEEIIGSWKILESELSNPLKVFCYPTGRVLDFGPREINILKKESFIGAVATLPGSVDNNSAALLYCLPRFELPDNMTDFIQYCSWIERANHNYLFSHSQI